MILSPKELQQRLQEIHIAGRLSFFQRLGRPGSLTRGRPKDTADIFVSDNAFSTISGVRYPQTLITGTDTWQASCEAYLKKGAWSSLRTSGVNDAEEASITIPEDTSIKSIPRFSRFWQTKIDSSGLMEFSFKSLNGNFTPMIKSFPTACRIASYTSNKILARFSIFPPYSSVR